MLISSNILANTDSQRVGMWKQYPAGTEHVYSYLEARGGHSAVIWAGLQDCVTHYLMAPVTRVNVLDANDYWTARGEHFNITGWMHIVEAHGGRLPIRIEQIPACTVVPLDTVLATVINTDVNVPWLPSWVEVVLLRGAKRSTGTAIGPKATAVMRTGAVRVDGKWKSVASKDDAGKRGMLRPARSADGVWSNVDELAEYGRNQRPARVMDALFVDGAMCK